MEVAKSNGQTTAKRDKAKAPAATPISSAPKAENVSGLVLYAAEALAVAVDRWIEDATGDAEKQLLAAHAAYRKLIRAPKREEAA